MEFHGNSSGRFLPLCSYCWSPDSGQYHFLPGLLTTISQSLILCLQSHPRHYGQNGLSKMQIKQLTFTLRTIWPSSSARPLPSGPACLSPCFTPHSCSGKSNHFCAYHTGPLGIPPTPQLVGHDSGLRSHTALGLTVGSAASNSVTMKNSDSWASVCKVGMVRECASQQLWELNNECTTHVKFLVYNKCWTYLPILII